MRRKDRELWDAVRATVTPLKTAVPGAASPSRAEPSSEPRALPTSAPPQGRRPHATASAAPSDNSLDRRTRQRLLRGKAEIEARLDLHGDTAEVAYVRLRGFLETARARGLRLVLVITGKGSGSYVRHTLHGEAHWHAPEREGRLRRLLPQWLDEPELKAMVVAYQPAHPRHGGGGAWYLRLRKK
jgi:DNA-nicking Smr family endonuclease